ncbi:transient receptor potential cation channel subfamily M member-like 2 [Mytilus edulis]|uniref:transient receptor potential cation channel subfamily M member-like 2 n=1 Tax=Mytilus edulis TaxID=6550 RepID=UPI0039F0F3AA
MDKYSLNNYAQKDKFRSIRPNTDYAMYLQRKSKYRKVLYTLITDTVDQADLLRRKLPRRWCVPTPEAIIAITGIHHQFNIKDKRNLKKMLIDAVISTGSWIVTCGTESGVVNFIEEAVNVHSTLKEYNIPIVGLMSERVINEIKPLPGHVEVEKIIDGKVKSVKTPVCSTKETLDPNHTQFIVVKDSNKKNANRSSSYECRKAFESFLSNIRDTDCKHAQYDTNGILPVVLVLLEGGIDALKTTWSVLKNNNPVVVINGSGGAADFLSICHQGHNRKTDSEQVKLSEYVDNLQELIRKCFEDKSYEMNIEATKWATKCLTKHELIRVYSLEEHTTKLDDLIQKAIFGIYTEYFNAEGSIPRGLTSGYTPKINAVQKQLKLVAKWKNYDIAKEEIFIAENRNHLTCLQELNEKRMHNLKNETRKVIKSIINQFNQKNEKTLLDYYTEFEQDVLHFEDIKRTNYAMDKNNPNYFTIINKATYFTNVSKSFAEMIKNMKDKSFLTHEGDLRRIVQGFVDEYEKDSVSELFQSSLLANKTDLVMLVMQKIESMSSFVLDNLSNIFRLSIKIKDFSAILLIQQHWEGNHDKEMESYLTSASQSELDKKKEKIKIKKEKKNNKVLLAVNSFIIDLFENPEFKLYEFKGEEELDLIHKDKPFHHLFVWAVLVNRREMAMIFWEQETDLTCSALFASAVLKELSEKAHFSKHMHLSQTLKKNSRHFENLACNVMTELYSNDRENALTTLVTEVGRYKSTPLEIAVSQKLEKFMAHTACQAKLNSIWNGYIEEYTPFWRIGMALFLPMLLIQALGFITFKTKETKSQQISPYQYPDEDPYQGDKRKTEPYETRLKFIHRFYNAPVTKFFVYMITYMTFVVIFAIFVLTDLYPLSKNPPSILEYLTWVWTLSIAIDEIRQIYQTNKGSFSKNLKYWANDVWNIFDIIMYLLFLLSVVLRCLLNSDQFYFARMSYAVTLSMFILRSMHFFFIQRYIGPKVVMIGRMLGDLGFFIALYALFLISFGIMYQAILFPNSTSSPWQLIKDVVYLPYWQVYGELNLEQIEGDKPTNCTTNRQIYTSGTRCPIKNQFNALLPAVYLILTNILLVNIIIAMFSRTFDTVQDNSEMIYKFHMYALVHEYYDRPMFPIPLVIHVWRLIVFYRDHKRTPKKYGSAFVRDVQAAEIERLHVVEKKAFENYQDGPDYARSRYDAKNMMTDERDINKEMDSTPTQQNIKDLREEMHQMRDTLIQEIRHLDYRQPVVASVYTRR